MKFQEDFLWGAATSSHQVEGNNKNNDWWRWEQEGKVSTPSGNACNQYELFKNDFKIAKELNHTAHRFSLEWSRIEPEEGIFDDRAIQHYRNTIEELKRLGMEPVATLHHFTLPVWLYEKGGWCSKGSEALFERFVEKIVKELGRDVKYWITINEPGVNIFKAYVEGQWPPGHNSFKEAIKMFVALLKAHCLAYNAIHRVYKENNWPRPNVGIAKNFIQYSPCRDGSFFDKLSTSIRSYYFNTLFMNAILSGWCIAPGFPIVKLPLKKALDFIGVNYYMRDFVHYIGLSPTRIFGDICSLKHHKDAGKRNFLTWEIYPRGIYNVLKEYSKCGMPVLITENGICTNNDHERKDFIREHLLEVERAIKDGVNVIGYLYWSLIDNFEWAEGYAPRFGLVEVDYKTQRRLIRPSAYVFSDIIKGKGN